MIREKLAGSTDARDRPVQQLTWDYPITGEHEEPSAEAVLAEINGWDDEGQAALQLQGAEGRRLDGVRLLDLLRRLRRRRRTRPRAGSRAGSRTHARPSGRWAWPANRRILYNRASADPDGKPWSERKRYVWWDEGQGSGPAIDVPDFDEREAPRTTCRRTTRRGRTAIAGNHPFIMQADGRGWLFVPHGLVDGPLPDALRAARVAARATRSTRSARTRRGSASTGRRTRPTRAGESDASIRSSPRPTG